MFRFTWKLFIVAKAKLFAPFPDLVASFNLLICVLAFVYCHIPEAQRAVPLTDEANLPQRNKEGAVDVLQVWLRLPCPNACLHVSACAHVLTVP